MTGLKITSKESKLSYQTKYHLKRINGIRDKGVKIHMLGRLIGRKNQQIKHLCKMIRELQQGQPDCEFCGISVYPFCPRCGKRSMD